MRLNKLKLNLDKMKVMMVSYYTVCVCVRVHALKILSRQTNMHRSRGHMLGFFMKKVNLLEINKTQRASISTMNLSPYCFFHLKVLAEETVGSIFTAVLSLAMILESKEVLKMYLVIPVLWNRD